MNTSVPRLRMFAGPNGSGKSTLKDYLSPEMLGVYLNPDEIEKEIRKCGVMDFTAFEACPTKTRIQEFFNNAPLLKQSWLEREAAKLIFENGRIDFKDVAVNSYFASAVVELLRHELLHSRISFTFETVMSHRSKIDFLIQAREVGYRTYLYFVATDDPEINISRIRNRVKLGGHWVPEQKVAERYFRSLNLLSEAICHTNRAYIFDNSGEGAPGKKTWLAEITDGKTMEVKTDRIPAWFKRSVLEKLL